MSYNVVAVSGEGDFTIPCDTIDAAKKVMQQARDEGCSSVKVYDGVGQEINI